MKNLLLFLLTAVAAGPVFSQVEDHQYDDGSLEASTTLFLSNAPAYYVEFATKYSLPPSARIVRVETCMRARRLWPPGDPLYLHGPNVSFYQDQDGTPATTSSTSSGLRMVVVGSSLKRFPAFTCFRYFFDDSPLLVSDVSGGSGDLWVAVNWSHDSSSSEDSPSGTVDHRKTWWIGNDEDGGPEECGGVCFRARGRTGPARRLSQWYDPTAIDTTLGLSGAHAPVAIRIRIDRQDASSGCRPTTDVLFFDGGYRVSMCYRTPAGEEGQAKAGIWASGQSGLLWFFDRENAEVLVKVLDGCKINGHRWVFVAPVTDLEFNLWVSGPLGRRWTHSNAQGVTASTRADTAAFPCR